MFSSRSVQIAAVFSDVFGQALPNLCRSFYNETKAEMFFSVFAVALLAEGVDRNTKQAQDDLEKKASPSSRRAWIEIKRQAAWPQHHRPVALLAEGVDRNIVDRRRVFGIVPVALLAEGVDRNVIKRCSVLIGAPSPSSRRAWIEIFASAYRALTSSCRPPRGGRG